MNYGPPHSPCKKLGAVESDGCNTFLWAKQAGTLRKRNSGRKRYLSPYAAAAAKSLQSRPTLCDPIDGSPPGSPGPGILQAAGVGCHFLLQCMKVKSESEVTDSCPTLSDPMDCSLPSSSVHGIFQARVLKWGAIVL